MRQVNTRFFFILLIAVLVFAGALFGVHRLQASNIANALLWQANQAETTGKPDVAARYLGRYLEFVPDDIEQRAHLATILSDEKVAVTPGAVRRAEFVINQVLAWDPLRHDLRQSLCRLAMASRKIDLAREHLDFLQAKLPDSGDVAFLQGQWQELQIQTKGTTLTPKDKEDHLQAARKRYEQAIAAMPTKVDAYLRLVAVLKQLDFGKEPKNAAEIDRRVAQAIQQAPDDAAVLSLAAQRAQEKGESAAALKYLEAGLKQNPTEARLYQALARIHSQQGNRKQAIAQLKTGLQSVAKPHHADLMWMLGNLLLDDEQMDAARKTIAQVREANPLSADYLEARCMMQQGRWPDAARTLEKLRPAFKSIVELSLQLDLYLGTCYQKMDEPLLQLSAFQRATKTDPSSAAARHGEATALAALGQRDDSMNKIRQLIAGNSNRAEAARWRIEYARLLLQGDVARDPKLAVQVRKELDDAEKDLPRSLEGAILRAELLFAEKRADDAEAEVRKAMQNDPKRFEPWVALATLAMAAKQPEKAEELLTEAAKRVGDTVEFRVAQIQFWGRHRPDRSDAFAALENGVERFTIKEQARVLEALAEAHFFANRMSESARLLRRLADMPPHAEDVRLRMQTLTLAILQDDEPEMRRVLAEVKRIEGEPATEWNYGEALRLIWRFRQGGNKELLDQARTLLTAAATRRANWPALLIARGDVDELQGKIEQAITSYAKALDLGSRDPHALYQLVLLLGKSQRLEEAEQAIRKAAQIDLGVSAGKRAVVLMYGKDAQTASQFARRLVHPQSKDYRDQLWLGQVLSAGGRESADAEAAFRQAVALGESRPETWVSLVRYLAATGQFAKAVDEIALAEKKLADDVKRLAVAQCYDALGAQDQAEQAYRAVLEQATSSVAANRAAGDYFLRAGKPRDAESVYRKLLEGDLRPGDADVLAARRGLALALARVGSPRAVPEALRLVGLALDASERLDASTLAAAPDSRLAQARVLAALPNHALRAKAIEVLDAMQEKQALPVEDQYQLARLLHLHGPEPANWQKAQAVLKGITTAYPNHARFLAFHANLLLLHKEVGEAEELIARLEKLEADRKLPPGVLGSVELKARALEQRGKELQAVALLQSFAQQKDALPSRTFLLAGLHGRLGNFQEAVDLCFEVKAKGYREEAYGAVIGLLRASKPAASQSAKFQSWQQQSQRVEEAVRTSVQRDEQNLVLRLMLADLMEMQGRTDQVESLCRGILTTDPNNLVALNNLAWLLSGKEGKDAEALELIQRAIAQHGPRPELLDTRAVVYLSLGKQKEAIQDLEKAVRDAPTPSRYFHLTRAHHLAKNAPLALAALQRANDLGLDVQQLHPIDQEVYPRIVGELQKQ